MKRRWSTAGRKTRPGTGSLPPVAIGAVVEATKPLKPPVERVALGDSASLQVVTRVNAEQALETDNAGADPSVIWGRPKSMEQ